ncbi:MAG: hypothetical protein KF822_05520 [Steroidobacteraceae bacterium]|nr:hypothetical protein [Steroidobacteraceae bacterium]
MRIPYIVAAALAVTAALAIEPPKDRPAAPASPRPAPSAEGPAPAPAEQRPAAEEDIDEELPPLPPEAADAGPPPQIFTPTEKVRADFPVSYPIDI